MKFYIATFMCAFSVIASAAVSGDFTYTDYDTYIQIDRYDGSGGAVSIPAAINDTPVTKIRNKAFWTKTTITSLSISSNLTSGASFPGCTTLASIEVDPNNLVYCSENGFLFDKEKTELIQAPPASVPGNYTIPDHVTSLNGNAFWGCYTLTTVNISSNLISLGDHTFFDCGSLSAIIVDEDNQHFCSPNGVLFNKNMSTLVRVPETRTGAFSIPYGVTLVDNLAFKNCQVTSVIIPSTVTRLDSFSFAGCDQLRNVWFLGDAPNTGTSVFQAITDLTTYYLPDSTGFTLPTWEEFPCEVAGSDFILPSGLPAEDISTYENWVQSNAPSWNAIQFGGIPAHDLEKAWLMDTQPVENMDSLVDLHIEAFNISSNKISLTLGLNINGQPKAGSVNGWLAINGQGSLTSNEWYTAVGQSADQDKISFNNGQATIVFDCPSEACFFMPLLQPNLLSGEVTIQAQ
jgi:hypothetical protein